MKGIIEKLRRQGTRITPVTGGILLGWDCPVVGQGYFAGAVVSGQVQHDAITLYVRCEACAEVHTLELPKEKQP